MVSVAIQMAIQQTTSLGAQTADQPVHPSRQEAADEQITAVCVHHRQLLRIIYTTFYVVQAPASLRVLQVLVI